MFAERFVQKRGGSGSVFNPFIGRSAVDSPAETGAFDPRTPILANGGAAPELVSEQVFIALPHAEMDW